MGKYTNLLSEQIAETIETYILEYGLKPGDALPSERKLSERFGVNRLTIRAALKRLRNEHNIYTEHGRGNFIAKPKYVEDTSKLKSFSSGWSEDGYVPSSKILILKEQEATLSVCRHLDLKLGEKVFYLNRVRFLDKDPITLEHSYIPLKFCTGIMKYDFAKDSLYRVLQEEYNLKLVRHDEVISICQMNRTESQLLEEVEGSPAFLIKGTTFDDASPVEYCISIAPAKRFVLSSKLKSI